MFVAFSSSYQLEAPVPRQPALLRLGPRLVGVREEVEGEGGQDACASDRVEKKHPCHRARKSVCLATPRAYVGEGSAIRGRISPIIFFEGGGGEEWFLGLPVGGWGEI